MNYVKPNCCIHAKLKMNLYTFKCLQYQKYFQLLYFEFKFVLGCKLICFCNKLINKYVF